MKQILEENQKKLNNINSIMDKVYIDNYDFKTKVRLLHSNKNFQTYSMHDLKKRDDSIERESSPIYTEDNNYQSIISSIRTQAESDKSKEKNKRLTHTRTTHLSDNFSSYNLAKTRERISNEIKKLDFTNPKSTSSFYQTTPTNRSDFKPVDTMRSLKTLNTLHTLNTIKESIISEGDLVFDDDKQQVKPKRMVRTSVN